MQIVKNTTILFDPYNLQGQRVDGKSLPKGIYIKNGKKFMVK